MEEEKSYSEIKKDFYYKYAKYVVPAISRFEDDRKRTFILAILAASSLIILGVIVLIFLIFADAHTNSSNSKPLQLPIFIIISGFIAYNYIKKKFENKIKKRVMPVVCSCFPKLKWSEISVCSDSNDYETSNLIPNFSGIYFDDCFKGEYNNVPFIIEENYAQIGSGKNRHTVFKGVIVTLNMNKNFDGNTIIRVNSLLHLSPSSKLHHTTLEDVEFEKKFDVYTDDDIEARYLITPSLMERLKSMQVAFRADNVSAAFYQDKFFIALHTNKDLFSIGSLTRHVCDQEQFFTMFEEILSIIKLIDHFKLNQKIGL